MSYNPHFFGPSLWRTMHVVAASATTKRKRQLYVNWINSLKETIPCDKCRLHFIENIKNLPVEPHSNNNISLFYHSWKLHDTVNEQTHKAKHLRLSYEEAFEMYFGKPQALAENQEQNTDSNNYMENDSKFVTQTNNTNGNCNGDCGHEKPYVEVEKNDFNSFRTLQKTKFLTKNE